MHNPKSIYPVNFFEKYFFSSSLKCMFETVGWNSEAGIKGGNFASESKRKNLQLKKVVQVTCDCQICSMASMPLCQCAFII